MSTTYTAEVKEIAGDGLKMYISLDFKRDGEVIASRDKVFLNRMSKQEFEAWVQNQLEYAASQHEKALSSDPIDQFSEEVKKIYEYIV